MTDYNNGDWWGWNGGECPVHPKSEIHGIEANGPQWHCLAQSNDWGSFRGGFRVTKSYVEPPKPLEIWVNFHADGARGSIWSSKDEAERVCPYKWRTVHFREVLE